MKTFLVYSPKRKEFVASLQDISNLKFIQYGFTWKYAIGLIKSKYAIFTIFVILSYIVFSAFVSINIISLIFAIFGTSLHFIFISKISKHKLIGTVQAKNLKDAKRIFVEQYILPKKTIFIKSQ